MFKYLQRFVNIKRGSLSLYPSSPPHMLSPLPPALQECIRLGGVFSCHPDSPYIPDVLFWSVILFFTTFFLSSFLKQFKTERYFPTRVKMSPTGKICICRQMFEKKMPAASTALYCSITAHAVASRYANRRPHIGRYATRKVCCYATCSPSLVPRRAYN